MQRLTKQSRARISDVLTDAGEFDLQTAKDNDADDLIKKLKIRKTRRTTAQGETIDEVTQDVELHDAQTATAHLAKVHKLLTDRVEVEQRVFDVNIELVELRATIHALVQTGRIK